MLPLLSKAISLTKKPEMVFLLFSSIFSCVILLISPPFQSPDEINHFLRTYQIADGVFVAEKTDQRVGGMLPESLLDFASHFYYLRWNSETKISADSILSTRKIKLNPNKKIFIDFPNTAMYSPVSYAPHATIVAVLRMFDTNPFYIYYISKLFISIFWISIIFFCIKIIPVYKWGIMALALLPMSLYIQNSFSADIIINSLSYLLVSSVLYIAIKVEKINKKIIILILLLSVLIGLAKIVYAPILLLLFLIPSAKFTNKINYYTFIFSSYAVTFLCILGWVYLTSTLYTPYSDYNPAYVQSPTTTLAPGASMPAQIAHIKANWSLTFVADFYYHSDPDLDGNIGVFGWMDTKLPKWFIAIHYLFLISILLFDQTVPLSFRKRFLFIFSIFISVTLILISQNLTWERVGVKGASGLQGRYFIPLFPLVYIFASFNTRLAEKTNNTFYRIAMFLFILFSVSFSLFTIYHRYYH